MTEALNTLATGAPAAAKGRTLGIRKKPNSFTPLARSTFIIMGPMGSGKSHLIESIPRCLRINTDLRVLSGGEPLCDSWPYIDKGTAIDHNGQPIQLDWKKIVGIKDLLLADASAANRAYDTVVLDTVDSTLDLLKMWACETFGKPNFRDIDGRQSYPAMAQELYNNFVRPLRAAGYGVGITAHVVSKTQFADEKPIGQMEDLRLSSSFWHLLAPPCDAILRCEGATVQEVVKKTQELANGQKREIPVTVESRKVLLYTQDPRLPAFLKIMYSQHFPQTWRVPAVGAWAALEAAYREAAVLAGVASPA